MHYGKRMKKSCVKRILAASLAVLMACPALPAIRPEAAKAKAPYVSLRTTFKTLKVGQTNKMTLKNNTIGWKVKKVATNDRTIAMVYGKTEAGFKIKGKSVGRTTVRAKLQTDARKKTNQHSVKNVRCRVNVIEPQENTEIVTEAEVSTQAELLKALANKNLKKLAIRTKDSANLTIPEGTYTGVELTVDAPASDIENNGTFQSITLESIKPDTWIENAVGNVMKVLAKAARIVVNKGARLGRIAFACTDAKVKLEVNGKVDEVSVSAKMELSISGKPEAPINTTIEESAAGTVLVSEAPVNITAHASVDITLNKGAENSTVDIRSKDAKVNVSNHTNSVITIKKADGTVEKKAVQVNTSSGSFSRPGTSTPNYPNITTGPAVTPTGPSIDVTDPPQSGDDPDSGGGWISPGEPSEPIKHRYPDYRTCMTVFQPEVYFTVTRGAIENTTVTTMSAVLICDIDPKKADLGEEYLGYAQCTVNNEVTSSAALVKLEMPEVVVLEEIDGDFHTTVPTKLEYIYNDPNFQDQFDYEITYVIYDKMALQELITGKLGESETGTIYIKAPLGMRIDANNIIYSTCVVESAQIQETPFEIPSMEEEDNKDANAAKL